MIKKKRETNIDVREKHRSSSGRRTGRKKNTKVIESRREYFSSQGLSNSRQGLSGIIWVLILILKVRDQFYLSQI